ncbi:MAG: T9SS type A sorting domain-containing protein [Bacteroidia bacterium]|jgi:hypothetical protein|nr:T9SS type A sorting domain-containing protein [Bacteroidia bacterium]
MKKLLFVCKAMLSLAIAQPTNPSFEWADSTGATAFWQLKQGKVLRYSVLQFGSLPFTPSNGNYFVSLETDTTNAPIACVFQQSFAVSDTIRKIEFDYLYLPQTSLQRAGFKATGTKWNGGQQDTLFTFTDSLAPVTDSNAVLLQWNPYQTTLPFNSTADTIHLQFTNDIDNAPSKQVRLLVDHVRVGKFPVGLETIKSSLSFDVFPNPASTQVNITSNKPFTQVEWYTMQGTQISCQKGKWQYLQMSTEGMLAGIYIIKISWPNGKIRYQKCLIQP